MKFIFIINPMAGPIDSTEKIKNDVKSLGEKRECLYYVTRKVNDATYFVRDYLAKHEDEEVCFIACGGDGTLCEVASGAVGHKNAAVSVYPSGSGNDFVKYYGGADKFLDIDALYNGEITDIDIMKIGERYSINICNFGFDTAVVETMQKVKRLPLLGGSNSYYAGIATALFTSMKNKCEVYADGELLNEKGRILLCTLGNGSFVGGSFNCSPKSDNTDGLMELCLVDPVSLPKFLSVLPRYQDGSHLESDLEKYVTYKRVSEVYLNVPDKFNICLDGELAPYTSGTKIVNIHKGIRFLLPKGAYATPSRKELDQANAK